MESKLYILIPFIFAETFLITFLLIKPENPEKHQRRTTDKIKCQINTTFKLSKV
ncbi:hypothetical protein HMPREF9444_00710 [Succinatimonas hippei YIT 12066]|uniref:Uncharacterized protein n=1 Tax=Succinatimonas hippei (strain DSM 22608 / JCM 16073 / KCTC 15190 / YIT 12066) TaxID=762983 RepID=E8LJ36_SUCHY|nr:hypothetical protein HMPREF9444_00710 [Succinatimonas hippei YIT 12066]